MLVIQLKKYGNAIGKKFKKYLPNKKDIEVKANAQNINIRDALFGGRTEAFKAYHKCNKHPK